MPENFRPYAEHDKFKYYPVHHAFEIGLGRDYWVAEKHIYKYYVENNMLENKETYRTQINVRYFSVCLAKINANTCIYIDFVEQWRYYIVFEEQENWRK